MLNIESVPAVAALEEILSVPGVDAVQVGPHDLTTSLGIPEQYDHPDFLRAVERIIRVARGRGLGAGVHYWLGLERQKEWIRMGANLVVHSGDISLFTDALNRDLRDFRATFGDAATSSAPMEPI